ncbi:AraC family transcriptional regulator [Pantoea coffeiphila]|uniref:AraC family transcriptional regulator n=1 Tax=Pantoea coffeiphila TaxID=1465635 RepID=A0A2S9I695_9GAMM|nr:AraC family transcriptional regulator [Pantoea coffeiphila]PRD13305.1 AraC family transcriptional regulator [Pantoea coffeiphila]
MSISGSGYLGSLALKFARNDCSRIQIGMELERFRHDEPTALSPCIYEPSVALILQGKKKVLYGDTELEYGPGSLLLTTLDVPVMSAVTEATRDRPYISLFLRLNMAVMAQCLEELPDGAVSHDSDYVPLTVWRAEDALINAFHRMAESLESEILSPLLYPLLRKEIALRLLTGESGRVIRQTLHKNNAVNKVSQAIQWIKHNYDKPFDLDSLAGEVYMSTSTFRQYFRKVTGVSPLQYQKKIRLLEARKLMINGDADASHTALLVGYESVSQFNREYHRLFGRPPLKDIRALQAGTGLSEAG